jgi:hypothetical protein
MTRNPRQLDSWKQEQSHAAVSVGFFFGIRHSFIPEAHDQARRLHEAVNDVLASNGLPPVDDPEEDPDPRGGEAGALGRSGLDHHGSRALAHLGQLAGRSHPHLHLLAVNPYRVVFVPRDLRAPATTSHREQIWDRTVAINVGSSRRLLAELLDMAAGLGIPLSNGTLPDDVARRIGDFEPLSPGESDVQLIEDTRTAWLLLHEVARLSIDLDVPLCLAG